MPGPYGGPGAPPPLKTDTDLWLEKEAPNLFRKKVSNMADPRSARMCGCVGCRHLWSTYGDAVGRAATPIPLPSSSRIS